MRSPRSPRRAHVPVMLGALSLAVLLAAPSATAQAPVVVEQPVESPVTGAAALLAEARDRPRTSRRLYRRLLDEFDGTPEAAVGTLELAELIRGGWNGGDMRVDEMLDDLHRIERSQAYQRPESKKLRARVPPLLLEIASWAPALRWLEDGRRGVPEGFGRCGEAMMALYSKLKADAPRAPTALWIGAQCFEAAGRWSEAAHAYRRLVTRYPRDPNAQRSLSYLAGGHLAVARYEDAARHSEQYAARYPKDDRETPDLLRNAYRLRVGLGQRALALADLDAYEARYRKDNPELAAKIFWMRRELLTTDDQRLKHAEAYLERYGKTGGRDRRIVAIMVIGQIGWRRACKQGLRFETCVSVEPPKPGGKPLTSTSSQTCAEPSMVQRTVYPRTAKPAEEAQRQFAAALEMTRDRIRVPEEDVARVSAFDDAVAMARVYQADREFEALLGLLSQVSRLSAEDPQLLTRIEKLAGKLERTYDDMTIRYDYDYLSVNEREARRWLAREPIEPEVSPFPRSIVWAIVATARIAQIAESRADAPLLREVPAEIVATNQVEAYCGRLRDQAAPLRAAAKAGYERCLALSVASGTFTEFSRLCEQALYERDPAGFPRLVEFVGGPAYPASRPDVAPLQQEAPPELPASADDR